MLPELTRSSTPGWLRALKVTHERIPIVDILQGSVFYPASAMDGRPVKYFGGFAHSFVYADCNVSEGALTRALDNFKGYRRYHFQSLTKEDLCFNSFQPILPEPIDGNPERLHIQADFSPYAVWVIYERSPEFDETHGPIRFSLLFVGGEGVATFQSLYFSNKCAPSVISLIRCDAFTGNWTQFFDPKKIFSRSVMQNPYGTPDYLFCDYGEDSPWPWYSKLEHTVASANQRLRLWGRR